MSHSITVLNTHGGPRADAILAGLAERLELPHIRRERGGRVQLWLQFEPEHAYDAVVAALETTGTDWRTHLAVVGPQDEIAEPMSAGNSVSAIASASATAR